VGDPTTPRNRRITIILMRGTGDGQATGQL